MRVFVASAAMAADAVCAPLLGAQSLEDKSCKGSVPVGFHRRNTGWLFLSFASNDQVSPDSST